MLFGLVLCGLGDEDGAEDEERRVFFRCIALLRILGWDLGGFPSFSCFLGARWRRDDLWEEWSLERCD